MLQVRCPSLLKLSYTNITYIRGAAIAQLNRHPAALGSSPKHTICAFIIYRICAIFVM